MKKRGRKKKSCQKVFRSTVYHFDQYWNIAYTEVYKDQSEKDFRTFIKANSYNNAKKILKKKLAESGVKVKSLQGFMFHSDYKGSNNRKLTFENWDQIKLAAFPNENDFLFKKEVPRPEGYSNRYNKTNYEHLKTIGFKKGAESYSVIHRKGKHLPIEKRLGKKWTGAEWVDWDKEEMQMTETRIIEALLACNNNRQKASIYLKMGRTQLYKLMKRTRGLDWWNKEYPIEKRIPPRVSREERSATQKRVMSEMMAKGHVPFGNLTEEQKEKKIKNIRASKKKKTKKRLDYWKPRIIEALRECDNSRTEAAKYLQIKICHLRKLLRETKHEINWTKDFPTKHYNPKAHSKI